MWIYGTGQVTIRRSPVIGPRSVSEGLDKRTNNLQVLAERVYAVSVECIIVAVLVDLCLCVCPTSEDTFPQITSLTATDLTATLNAVSAVGGPLEITWGDGGTGTTPSGVSVTHTYTAAGTYTVTVKDPATGKTTTKPITVPPA